MFQEYVDVFSGGDVPEQNKSQSAGKFFARRRVPCDVDLMRHGVLQFANRP